MGLLEKIFKPVVYTMVGVSISTMSIAIWTTMNGPFANDMGATGQLCYPNSTCDSGLTCFSVAAKHICDKAVRPVHLEHEKFCYAFKDKDGEHTPCFMSNNECVKSFSRVIPTDAEILQGCGYEGDFARLPDRQE